MGASFSHQTSCDSENNVTITYEYFRPCDVPRCEQVTQGITWYPSLMEVVHSVSEMVSHTLQWRSLVPLGHIFPTHPSTCEPLLFPATTPLPSGNHGGHMAAREHGTLVMISPPVWWEKYSPVEQGFPVYGPIYLVYFQACAEWASSRSIRCCACFCRGMSYDLVSYCSVSSFFRVTVLHSRALSLHCSYSMLQHSNHIFFFL